MPECESGEDCDDGNECTEDVCDLPVGTCSNSNLPVETPCDCVAQECRICDGLGACTDCVLDEQCANSCIVGRTCNTSTGVCEGGQYSEKNTPCDGDGFCDGAGACVECNDDAQCAHLDECVMKGTCDLANGVCDNPIPVTDGTPCAGGVCQSGLCALDDTALPCTEQGIRNAIAAGGGPYTFDCDGPQTVVTEHEIVINKPVTLDGEGKLTVDGNGTHRVFAVACVSAELTGFTVTGGFATGGSNHGFRNQSGGGIYVTSFGTDDGIGFGFCGRGALVLRDSTVTANAAAEGGGIYLDEGSSESPSELTLANTSVSGNSAGGGGGIANERGVVTLTNSTVSDNDAQSLGGGIWNGGHGTLRLTDSTVSGNRAGGNGGGIAGLGGMLTLTRSIVSNNESGNQGGGVCMSGNWTLMSAHSTVSDNTAIEGGGVWSGGGSLSTLSSSTVSGNTATQQGGGIFNQLGWTEVGLPGPIPGGTVTITNSTISGNAAAEGGGVMNALYNDFGQEDLVVDGMLSITSSTVSANTATAGSGISNYGPAVFRNSLIDNACVGTGSNVSVSGNIESPGNTCGFDQPTDLFDVTAEELNLGELADNGGPTQTHALLTEPTISVAIDRIPEAVCLDADGAALTTDQRGLARPVPIPGPEAKCDVGAFEEQGP